DVVVEVASRRAAAVAAERALRDRAVRTLRRAGVGIAHQQIGRAGVAVVAAGQRRARAGRIAGFAGLDHAVATARRAIGVVVGIACAGAGRAAAGVGPADRDGRVLARRCARICAAEQGIAGAAVAVVAAGRARARRIARFAGFDHAVAAAGLAIGIVGGIAA